MAQQQWFVVRGEKEEGPFTGQQLKEMAAGGRLLPTDQVRRNDVEMARPASAIKGLFPAEGATGSARATAPAQQPTPSPQTNESDGPKKTASKKMLVILSGVAGACLLLCCGGFGVVALFGNRMQESARKELAEEDALWDKGEKADAVKKYRSILGSRANFLKEEDRPRAYGRVIDFDVESGNAESAKQLLAEAARNKVTPQVSQPEAKALLASADDGQARPKVNQPGSRPPDQKKLIAEVEASNGVSLPAFSEDEYKYDYGKDDYTSIPAGAKKETRKRVIKGGAEGLAGKPETMEGYVDMSGRFVEHGTYITWTDDTQTKKLREGKMLHGKQHGLTTFFFPSGKKRWEMYFVQDKNHGVARFWFENGQLSGENHWVEGKFHGQCQSWFETGGMESDQTWVRGKKQGVGKRWWKDGSLAFVGGFRDGRRHGKLYSWNEDGSPGESGDWEDGKPKGRCRLAFSEGKDRWYFIEADDREWRGGTTGEFLARMYYFCLRDRPDIELQFDPKAGIANAFAASEGEFFSRFGKPTQNSLDEEKAAGAPPGLRNQFRVWSYRCGDGVVTLRVQPTQTGTLMVTARP